MRFGGAGDLELDGQLPRRIHRDSAAAERGVGRLLREAVRALPHVRVGKPQAQGLRVAATDHAAHSMSEDPGGDQERSAWSAVLAAAYSQSAFTAFVGPTFR